ncbi:hypothetical protein [Methanobacterium sp.]|uniref:hypothetical protein n=1 Tax=Methanobacterium sp. TaxID=2164 RepID=UPI003C75DFC0
MNVKNLIFFTLFLAIYLILGAYFIGYYQYDTISRDLIVIISVTKLYAAYDFSNAVNGYWGPFFSWLLVPFILSNPTPQSIMYTTKILSIITGFFTIIGTILLSYRFEMNDRIRIGVIFPTIFVILYFALHYNPVDLLLACFLIYYMYFIFNSSYYQNLYNSALCGILASMAYLTKSYAFPFFIIHFIMMNSFYYLKYVPYRKKVLKNLFLGLIVFFVISGAWSTVISEKYGQITFGTSGKYNYEESGPLQHGSPIWDGFMKPPNDKSVSAWEDPSYFKMKSWNPLDSWKSFVYLLKLILNNFLKLIEYFQYFTYFSMIIIIIYLSFLFKSPSKLISGNGEQIYPILTLILFCAGYLVIFVEFRYFFVIYVLIMLMGGYLLNILFKSGFLNKWGVFFILLLFILSLSVVPLSSLINNQNVGQDYYTLSSSISKYNIHGNIASNDKYRDSLNIAYYLNVHYYGRATNSTTKKPMTDIELENSFKEYNIDYYFFWGNSNTNADLLKKYKEITNGTIKGLKIYKIR